MEKKPTDRPGWVDQSQRDSSRWLEDPVRKNLRDWTIAGAEPLEDRSITSWRLFEDSIVGLEMVIHLPEIWS